MPNSNVKYRKAIARMILLLICVFLIGLIIALWDAVEFSVVFPMLVILIGLVLIKKEYPTSLWNIACAVGLINGLYLISIVVTSRVVFFNRVFDITSTMVLKAALVLTLFLISGKLGYVGGSKLMSGKKIHFLDITFQRKVYIAFAVLVLIPVGLIARSWLMTNKGVNPLAIIRTIVDQGSLVIPTDNRLSAGGGINLSTKGRGYLVIVANIATGGILLLLMLAETKKFWWFGFIVSIFTLLLYALTGRRTQLVPVLLGIVFSYHHRIKKIRFKYWILSALIIYLVFVILLIGRLYFLGGYFEEFGLEIARFFVEDMRLGIGRSADGFFLTIIHADGFGIRPWSLQAWYSFLWYPIPRVLFSSKPTYTPLGWEVTRLYVNPSFNINSEGGGVAPTIVTTLYLNAGYFGTVLGAVFLGLLLGCLDKLLLEHPTSGNLLLHLMAWVLVFILFRTGDLTAAVTQSITMFGGFIVFLILLSGVGDLLKNKYKGLGAQ
jgi:oligosaccharide repeat unit polymerase